MTMDAANDKADDDQDAWDSSYFENSAFAADPTSKSWDSTFDVGGFLDEDSIDKERVDCDTKVYPDCFCNQLREHMFIRRLERYAKVEFNWRTFIKELVYHLFFPFSIPLMMSWEGGTRALINRQYWGSRLSGIQWLLSINFFMVNCLTPLYVSPDIVIADVLYLMRSMILATKYGFINKGEMREMRDKILPMQVHADRTLVLAWTNPIPTTVLKRELLLAAIRKDLVRCTAAVRLLPGASTDAVRSVMRQLSVAGPKDGDYCTPTKGSGWGASLDKEVGLDQTFSHCPACVKHKCTKDRLEDRWISLSMAKIGNDPEMLVPKDVDGRFLDTDESAQSSQRSEYDPNSSDRPCCVLDLPALMVAAFIIQKSGELLKKKILLHQIFSNPWRVYWSSAFVGVIHGLIPFVTRAIAGSPSTFGGIQWYHIVVSVSSFAISYSAMSACVMFMLAGSADFRRRYFSSRLLNTMLKDGWFGEDKTKPKKRQKLIQQKLLQQKSVYHLGLTVDFSEPRSMAGWWAVRVLVHDFGMVFHMRVRQYASYFATYCALLMGFLIVELFASGASTSVYVLAVVVFDLVTFLFLLCLIVFPGGEANDMNHEHGASLVRKKMLISSQLHRSDSGVGSDDRNVLRAALEVLQSVSQAVFWDNSTNKVTILGFTAGGELIAVLIGFGSAAIGIAAQQLTSQLGS